MRIVVSVLLFFVMFTVLTRADYLNTDDYNHCIINLTPRQDDRGWCYHDQNQNRDECDRYLDMEDLIDGYYYDSENEECLLKNDLKISGLTQDQWDSYLALLAHVMGFTMLFLINFLSVLIVRK